MLRLKYLFNDVNLAEMILKNWDYDEGSTEMFKFYRISSNAIYPFKYKGRTQLLRFAPALGRLHFLSSQYTPSKTKRWS
jgi:hypothetical protein